jgi:2-oxoglutarate ferredoxin oxidoreductase subunit alpha
MNPPGGGGFPGPQGNAGDRERPLDRVATVNGTGSQSANNIFAKSLFGWASRSSAKNLFPSNIQGLPTWFTIRVNKNGYTARKKELDWLVGMNAATWEKDVANLRPGAVVMWNSNELPEAPVKARGDLIASPIPMADLLKPVVADAKLKKMLINMVYVGACAQLLGIEEAVVLQAIKDNFKSKQKAVDVNVQCFHAGMNYAKEKLEKRDPWRVERMDARQQGPDRGQHDRGARRADGGGATVVGWYPSAGLLARRGLIAFAAPNADRTVRFVDVQCEDELASIGMVLSAGWAGARHDDDGPGISLMSGSSASGTTPRSPR